MVHETTAYTSYVIVASIILLLSKGIVEPPKKIDAPQTTPVYDILCETINISDMPTQEIYMPYPHIEPPAVYFNVENLKIEITPKKKKSTKFKATKLKTKTKNLDKEIELLLENLKAKKKI